MRSGSKEKKKDTGIAEITKVCTAENKVKNRLEVTIRNIACTLCGNTFDFLS